MLAGLLLLSLCIFSSHTLSKKIKKTDTCLKISSSSLLLRSSNCLLPLSSASLTRRWRSASIANAWMRRSSCSSNRNQGSYSRWSLLSTDRLFKSKNLFQIFTAKFIWLVTIHSGSTRNLYFSLKRGYQSDKVNPNLLINPANIYHLSSTSFWCLYYNFEHILHLFLLFLLLTLNE